MKPYNCIIVDDKEVDGLMVLAFAKRFHFLNVVSICKSASEAIPYLENNKIDVLFLDIDMPEINGLQFRKQFLNVPVCVYITSHPEHALDSFELDTLDFIVKPLKFERFSQAIKRLEDYLEIKEKAQLFEASYSGDTVLIKIGHEQSKIKLHEILYLEGLKDYTKIVTTSKNHCVFLSIGNLLKEATFQHFVRVHRSFAVQKILVQSLHSNSIILANNVEIPIGRSYKDVIENLLI